MERHVNLKKSDNLTFAKSKIPPPAHEKAELTKVRQTGQSRSQAVPGTPDEDAMDSMPNKSVMFERHKRYGNAPRAQRNSHEPPKSAATTVQMKRSASASKERNVSIPTNAQNRAIAAQRRTAYGKALDMYRDKPVTYIKIGSSQIVTIKDLNNLKKYFDDMDEDGSGIIEAHEIESKMDQAQSFRDMHVKGLLTNERWEQAKLQFGSLGINMDGPSEGSLRINFLKTMGTTELSFEGMLKMVYPKATKDGLQRCLEVYDKQKVKQTTPDLNDLKDLTDLWDVWDIDGNGELDYDEFAMALKMLQVPADEIQGIYDAIDDDGNGFISKSEFAAWWFTDQTQESSTKVDFNLDCKQSKKMTRQEKKTHTETIWKDGMHAMGLSKGRPC